MKTKHPRDTYLTVYGRKPVVELLEDPEMPPADKVWLDSRARGEFERQVEQLCARRGIVLHRVAAEQVSHYSKNPKQDQGIAADVLLPQMLAAEDYWEQAPERACLLALDGITTPANLGLIIRTATGLGIDGLVLPRHGTSSLNPLVIKASAGVIFKSPLLKCEKLVPALLQAKAAGFVLYGLAGQARRSLFDPAPLAPRSLFVLGNESQGLSPQTLQLIDHNLSIPMANGVESLNVACAAAVLCGELARRKL